MRSQEAIVAAAGSQGFRAPKLHGSHHPRVRKQSRKSAAPVAPAAQGAGADADSSSPGGDDSHPSPGDEYVSSDVEQSPSGGFPPQQQQHLRRLPAAVSHQTAIPLTEIYLASLEIVALST